jgi:D-alanine--poly(phosphoribitol) ligase subunit 1
MSAAPGVPATPSALDGLFTQSVKKWPDRPALFVAEHHWSYRELDHSSRRIAACLGDQPPLPRRTVGLIYGRSLFTYAAILAILRSGNVYVPLNGKLPVERLRTMMADAGIETVLVDTSEQPPEDVLTALRGTPNLRIIYDRQAVEMQPLLQDTLDHTVVPDQLAYIIYTSGSTGKPKGVAITHASACSCIDKLYRMSATTESDRFSQFSVLSFDVSVADLFLCWKSGAALYVPAEPDVIVPMKFANQHALTVWSSVPSIASFLLKLRLLVPGSLPSVRLSMFCGEALPTEVARAWSEAALNSRVLNIYGPTECTIFATYHEYDRISSPQQGVVPIGIPLPGLQCMIVDDGREVVVEDVPGELWLAGDQLALEYWQNPVATRSAFVHFHPSDDPTRRWYRTGDIVSHRDGVGLSFRGRLDRQIKLRGHRVELQEVESALREVTLCAQVAVIPIRTDGGICEKIVAYCERLTVDENSIKAACLQRLPGYMVPERIFEMATFPLSANGKVDYLAIAARARQDLA